MRRTLDSVLDLSLLTVATPLSILAGSLHRPVAGVAAASRP